MKNNSSASRRRFLQQIGATSMVAASAPLQSFAAKQKAEERILQYEKPISVGVKIRLGVIGFGVQGHLTFITSG